jgi:hypothetical protein
MANRCPGKRVAIVGFDNSSGVYPAPNQVSFHPYRESPDSNLVALPISLFPISIFGVSDFSIEENIRKIGGPGHLFDTNPKFGKERNKFVLEKRTHRIAICARKCTNPYAGLSPHFGGDSWLFLMLMHPLYGIGQDIKNPFWRMGARDGKFLHKRGISSYYGFSFNDGTCYILIR